MWRITAVVGCLLAGCTPGERPSAESGAVSDTASPSSDAVLPPPPAKRIAVISDSSTNQNVQNGEIFEKASLSLEGVTAIVAPPCNIRPVGRPGEVRLFIVKRLHYMGHPSFRMDIDSVDRYMGVATKRVADVLSIGTFGEWNSHIEGGAGIAIDLIVPSDVRVHLRTDLSGELSIAHDLEPDPIDPKKKRPRMSDNWWAPTEPADGWTRLKTEPDVEAHSRWK